MAKFRVTAESVSFVYLDVEAADEDEAQEIGELMDGGDYHYYDGEWRKGSVLPLDDDAEVDVSASALFEERCE